MSKQLMFRDIVIYLILVIDQKVAIATFRQLSKFASKYIRPSMQYMSFRKRGSHAPSVYLIQGTSRMRTSRAKQEEEADKNNSKRV